MDTKMHHLRIKTEVPTNTLLEILQDNLDNHYRIVEEAKKGFFEKAKAALQQRLKELEDGTLRSLRFSLEPPVDYSAVYRTAIRMLKMHTQPTIVLEAEEFRNLVEDDWDWSRGFFQTNKSYSPTAERISEQKGW